jgi:lipopolysaccharide assembly outer membrane protein LptD (OstA)
MAFRTKAAPVLSPRSSVLLGSFPLSAQEPFGTADPFESRFKTKTHFQIKFKVPEKGGEVRLYTRETVHYEKDVYWEGSEDVEIEYQDVKIRADKGRYDFPTKTATLEGNVIIDQGPSRMAGSRGTFALESKTGRLEDATADLAPTYHIIAEWIEKVGESTYRVHNGIFTACDVPDPAWSFSLSDATVTMDDYAHMKNVSFRIGSVPLLYTPWLVWPTKEDRASGFLVPGVGYNGRRGAYLGLTYYRVTGRSTDLTSNVDLYSSGSFGLGEEFRWAPSLESAGLFQGYAIHDKEATVCAPSSEVPSGGNGPCTMPNGSAGVFTTRVLNRWKIRLDHVSDDLPYGFRGVLAVRDYSDDQYLQDIERSFALSSASQILSRGFLTKNFGNNSINFRVERSESFFGTTVLQERLPSLEFFHRTSRIGASPLFLALESSLSYLYVNRGANLPRGAYERADFHPMFSLPWKRIPWLSVTAKFGGRWTGYSDSTDEAQTHFEGSSFTRRYGEAGLSIVGPSFSRIFDAEIGRFGKFKHIIEPRIDYNYVSDVSDPARLPTYDEIDLALGQNQVRYAIVNRLLARPSDPTKGSAEEIASLEISQTHAFKLPQNLLTSATAFQAVVMKDGPVETVLRLAPGRILHFDGRMDYDTRASQVTGASATAAVSWGSNTVNATWYASRPILTTPLPEGSPSPNTDQMRLAAGIDLTKTLRFDTQLNYDARTGQLLEDRSLIGYKGSCYTVLLEVRQLRLPPTTRRDYRFVINLKDIGTLLDVNGSLDRIFGQ